MRWTWNTEGRASSFDHSPCVMSLSNFFPFITDERLRGGSRCLTGGAGVRVGYHLECKRILRVCFGSQRRTELA